MFLKFFFFFAYGKFGSHGLFSIYWISRNNGPRCIGATLYYEDTLMDFIDIWPDDGYRSKVFISTDSTPGDNLGVKVMNLEFSLKGQSYILCAL